MSFLKTISQQKYWQINWCTLWHKSQKHIQICFAQKAVHVQKHQARGLQTMHHSDLMNNLWIERMLQMRIYSLQILLSFHEIWTNMLIWTNRHRFKKGIAAFLFNISKCRSFFLSFNIIFYWIRFVKWSLWYKQRCVHLSYKIYIVVNLNLSNEVLSPFPKNNTNQYKFWYTFLQ